jgi:hypothetical protein
MGDEPAARHVTALPLWDKSAGNDTGALVGVNEGQELVAQVLRHLDETEDKYNTDLKSNTQTC